MSLNDIYSTFSLYVSWPTLTGKLIYCCVVKVKSVSAITMRYGTKVFFCKSIWGKYLNADGKFTFDTLILFTKESKAFS